MATLSKRTLAEIREFIANVQIDLGDRERWVAQIDYALGKGKRHARLQLVRTKAKAAEHRDETAEIRQAVWARSKGRCENQGCGAFLGPVSSSGHMDHFFGGSGRRREMQAVATCWRLCADCDHAKTNNIPGLAHWAERFIEHCHKYGAARDGDAYRAAAEAAGRRLP